MKTLGKYLPALNLVSEDGYINEGSVSQTFRMAPNQMQQWDSCRIHCILLPLYKMLQVQNLAGHIHAAMWTQTTWIMNKPWLWNADFTDIISNAPINLNEFLPKNPHAHRPILSIWLLLVLKLRLSKSDRVTKLIYEKR